LVGGCWLPGKMQRTNTPHRTILIRDYRDDDPERKTRSNKRLVKWWLWPLGAMLLLVVYLTVWGDVDLSPPVPPAPVTAPAVVKTAVGDAKVTADATTPSLPSLPPEMVGLAAMKPGMEQTVRVPNKLLPELAFSIATVPRPLTSDNPSILPIERNSVASWLVGGVTEVLWLTEPGAENGAASFNVSAIIVFGDVC
jgi:hypothetical protein